MFEDMGVVVGLCGGILVTINNATSKFDCSMVV